MNDAEYKERMDMILQTIATADFLTEWITEEDLDIMVQTCHRADVLAFILTMPMHLTKADERTEIQEDAINLIRKIRAFSKKARDHIEHYGPEPVPVDADTIDRLKPAARMLRPAEERNDA